MLQESSNALQARDGCHGFEKAKLEHHPAKRGPRTVNLLRSKLRALIRTSLVRVTGDPDAEMCWAKYEQQIVAGYHVDIEGWPDDVLFKDLSKQTLRLKPLKNLVRRWELGLTGFRQLTEAEIHERQQTDASPHMKAQRVDKGDSRPQYQKGPAGRRKKRIRHTKTDRFVHSEDEME
ncbi:hypothetical protein EWM64_g831 [Hericium alpestre]|uniref:Uncharacterized protein n=1 Tax=Hericium alpestre TaxID=135208 RepID=A0A4Z0AA17_9AGAM|nr:hypothetical protein EWM64_g831 [Hericium alpestre]